MNINYSTWKLQYVKIMLISDFQNETTEENQRKLSLEMQKIREEIGEYLIKLIKHLISPI